MDDNLTQQPPPSQGESAAQRLRRILSAQNGAASDDENTNHENAGAQAKRENLPSEPAEYERVPPEPKEATSGAVNEWDASDDIIEAPIKQGDTQPIAIPKETQAHAGRWKAELKNSLDMLKDAWDEVQGFFKRMLPRNQKSQRVRNARRGGAGKPPSNSGDRKPFFSRFKGKPLSCIASGLVGFIFLVIILGILGLSFIIIQYFLIAADLPSVADLRQYASKFETTRIYDRDGRLIYEILDPNAGRRSYKKMDEISPYLVAATIATEDKDFYTNPGFDPLGIVRAFWQNYTSREVVSGASTITQQLARTLLLSPEERSLVTTRRKAREIVLAAEITRKYSKDEILELYLNEIYYGNLAYGIQAAAETYFSNNAAQLDLAQASFLAGLPQAPAIYDVYTNRGAALTRQVDVLNLMYQLSKERSCIRVNRYDVPICVTLNEAVAAAQETEAYPFVQTFIDMPYPHWVNFIRAQLESRFDPQTIYRSGFKVYTTLDPKLQDYAQSSVREQVDALAENDASNGALVAIRPSSGEILAMVGSADFFNEPISGQINMAAAPRQPGSSIKPLTYTAAFEKGWTPSTLIWDVPSEFPPSGRADDTRDPYEPVNYDRKFHGPVLMRTALGSSYNVPAVKALDYIGIYDDPNTPQKEGFIAFAERMGITTLTREDYGLSLTLGGGDVSLLELTGAFSIFANNGKRVAPYSIERIEDHRGELVYQHEVPPEEQVIRAEHAYLISHILSDNSARTPAFGANSVLKLPFNAAVKTGTTDDFRDNWTLGYTPDIAIGVWIGNADYTPMKNISGVSGAAPLWSRVIQWTVSEYMNGEPTRFNRPDGIEEHVICSVSGTKPSERCSLQKGEVFAQGQPPLEKEDDLWKEVEIDTWTNLKAGSACSEFAEQKMTMNVTEKWALKWLKENEAGKAWAKDNGFDEPLIFTPEKECKGDDARPTIVFVGMSENMDVTTEILDIYAVVSASQHFKQFKLQYGIGNNPEKWRTLLTSKEQYTQPQNLISWDVYEAGAVRITLRIYMQSTEGTFAEKRIHLNLMPPEQAHTPTGIPTEVPTDMPLPTNTPQPTETLTPEPILTLQP